LGSFSPKDLDSRLGGCETRGIDYLFFKSTRRIKRKDSRLFDPQLDSLIQPKALGLLHMECDYSSHPIQEKEFGA
jgi:hypothetical protein